jgi:hypothetical protein
MMQEGSGLPGVFSRARTAAACGAEAAAAGVQFFWSGHSMI